MPGPSTLSRHPAPGGGKQPDDGPGRAAPSTTLEALVGNTPLIPLRRIAAEVPGVEILAKAEWFNPGGSVKDRAALAMILDGERSGALARPRAILDATSGNTGIAYAWIGASRRHRVELAIPESASRERIRILRAYGAELELTPAGDGTDGAILRVRERHEREPDRYFFPNQYDNPANWQAHYHGTGSELLEQTGGALTHFVAGLGTSGTFVGTGRRLREADPSIRLISFQPDSPVHGIEGMKHMETALRPGIYDSALADEDLAVSTEDAYGMVRRLAREEGLLVGVSSGAAAFAALEVARRLDQGVVVTVFPDSGDRYLSERFWEAP